MLYDDEIDSLNEVTTDQSRSSSLSSFGRRRVSSSPLDQRLLSPKVVLNRVDCNLDDKKKKKKLKKKKCLTNNNRDSAVKTEANASCSSSDEFDVNMAINRPLTRNVCRNVDQYLVANPERSEQSTGRSRSKSTRRSRKKSITGRGQRAVDAVGLAAGECSSPVRRSTSVDTTDVNIVSSAADVNFVSSAADVNIVSSAADVSIVSSAADVGVVSSGADTSDVDIVPSVAPIAAVVKDSSATSALPSTSDNIGVSFTACLSCLGRFLWLHTFFFQSLGAQLNIS